MKLISLNTWGGRAGKEKLFSFFKEHSDTDIFCLQEIWTAPHEHYEGVTAGGLPIDNSKVMTQGMQEISAVLPDHVGYFRPHVGDNYGLFMLVHKNISVLEEGDLFVYKEKGFIPEGDIGGHARNIQYMTIMKGGDLFTIVNFHGLWNGKGKTDSPDRIEQSQKIVKFLDTITNEYLVCGDFNLMPDTESIRIVEGAGLRNLVTISGVQSTRTSFYNKPDKFADYILISKGVRSKDFKVLPDEVSDHAALFCEIE